LESDRLDIVARQRHALRTTEQLQQHHDAFMPAQARAFLVGERDYAYTASFIGMLLCPRRRLDEVALLPPLPCFRARSPYRYAGLCVYARINRIFPMARNELAWNGREISPARPLECKWSKPTLLYLEEGGFIHEHM
jgi:hypothetical protein